MFGGCFGCDFRHAAAKPTRTIFSRTTQPVLVTCLRWSSPYMGSSLYCGMLGSGLTPLARSLLTIRHAVVHGVQAGVVPVQVMRRVEMPHTLAQMVLTAVLGGHGGPLLLTGRNEIHLTITSFSERHRSAMVSARTTRTRSALLAQRLQAADHAHLRAAAIVDGLTALRDGVGAAVHAVANDAHLPREAGETSRDLDANGHLLHS